MSDGDDQDQSQKTEEPSARKLQEARKKGQVPLSREVNTWLMMLAATLLIAMSSVAFFGSMGDALRGYIEQPHLLPLSPLGPGAIMKEAASSTLWALAFPLLILMIAAFVGPFAQAGPIFSAESLKPDISKISPAKGFKRLFSLRSIMEFLKGLLKIMLVSIVFVVIIYPYYGQIDHMVGIPLNLALDEIYTLILKFMIGVLIVLIVIAVIDFSYQRYDHYQKMRMTKQEVKDEYRQTEGDPHVKQKLRQLRAQKAQQRMMQSVPKADVVITNPTHFAIALEYKPEAMDAPVCVAKGVDEVALRIRETAKEHNIEIVENKPLARALYDTVELDSVIPEEHFQAVAQIISYVFKKQGKL